MATSSDQRPARRQRADGLRSRATILAAAARLATVEGLEGLSIARLADHIGMSKSGLYAHFGSKEQLQLATVETAGALFHDDVVAPCEAIADPVARLHGLADAFLRHVEHGPFPGGCFFVAAAAELDTHPGPLRTSVARYQREWLTRLEQLVEQARAAGALRAETDPVQLAFELDAFLLMGNLAFLLHGGDALERARAAVRAQLAAAAG